MRYTEQELIEMYKHEPLSVLHLDLPAKRLYYWQFHKVVRLRNVFQEHFPDWEITALADSIEYQNLVGAGLSIPWKSADACWYSLRNNYWEIVDSKETALIAATLLGLPVE